MKGIRIYGICLCLLFAMAISMGTASAVVDADVQVPQEYRGTIHNDMELWLLAEKNIDEMWAQKKLEDLARYYSNDNRIDSLRIKMAYLVKNTEYVIPQFVADMVNDRLMRIQTGNKISEVKNNE